MILKERNLSVLEETNRLNSLPHRPCEEKLPLLEDEWND